MAERNDKPAPSDADLTLVTLGGGALYAGPSDGRLEQIVGPGKHLAVLIYLALSPRRSASRDHLVNLLSADLAPSDARQLTGDASSDGTPSPPCADALSAARAHPHPLHTPSS